MCKRLEWRGVSNKETWTLAWFTDFITAAKKEKKRKEKEEIRFFPLWCFESFFSLSYVLFFYADPWRFCFCDSVQLYMQQQPQGSLLQLWRCSLLGLWDTNRPQEYLIYFFLFMLILLWPCCFKIVLCAIQAWTFTQNRQTPLGNFYIMKVKIILHTI